MLLYLSEQYLQFTNCKMILMNLIVCCVLHTDNNVHVRYVFAPFHMTILLFDGRI